MANEWFDPYYTPEGGRYYRAYAFFWASVAIVMPFATALTALAYANPLWFREQFMNLVGHIIEGFCQWRNYRMKAIYMGCDPAMWEALTKQDSDD